MQLQLVTISKENFYSVWNRQKGTPVTNGAGIRPTQLSHSL